MGTNKFSGINQISYNQAISQINTGDILLCSGDYLVSELIKKVSDSLFSHVGLLFCWNEHVLVLESVEDDGVRLVPLSHYLKNYENSEEKYNGTLYIARHVELANHVVYKEKIKKMLEKAVNLLNRNYDKNEIAEIVSRIALGIGRHKDDDQYICSELVDECFKQVGIYFSRDPEGFIYPEHVAADSKVLPLFEIIP